ncbi:hypothetical protein [Streptomyces sp. NPDC001978]|uniref:hypothetical protein n=1 Tax=Streptomyces sp. NPDC001978 TaxID=3364627 RepID=UPI00367CAE56
MLGDRYAALAGAQAWATFLFASYLFGHLIFLLGSWLDEFYDWARRYTQITLLARRGRLLPWPARAMVWLVFKRERNVAADRATRIKQQALGPLQAKDAINTLQWSKALLNIESPTSLAVIGPSSRSRPKTARPRQATSRRASCCTRPSNGDRALQGLHPLLQRPRLQRESRSTGRHRNEKGQRAWPTPLTGGCSTNGAAGQFPA